MPNIPSSLDITIEGVPSTITVAIGTPGPAGSVGPAGPAGATGPAGPGLPVGGVEGQIVVKNSATDYDTVWQDNFASQLRMSARNETGATLAKGTVVYISGASGNKPLLSKAIATSDATSAQTMGVVTADILTNQNGTVTVRGLLENLNTSAYAAGAQLYLSGTTAGEWTSTKPSAPIHLVYVGIVVRSHATQGSVEVAIQNGFELHELHDVALASEANNDLLAYESATDLWKNKSASTLGLLTTSAAASTYAPLASPALTGNPTAPTPLTSDNDTSIATTAFVKAQGYITTAPVTSVAGKTGAVTLAVADVSGAAPLASPALTGTPTAPTATPGTSTTQLATTAFVTAVDILKANIASPTFTGVPAAPTASPGTSTTQIATTAFVTAVDILKAPIASPTFTGTVTIPAGASISGYLTTASAASTYAPLASPTFTGDPKAPTPATSDNDTSIATTAFVKAQSYLTTTSAASTYQTLSGMSSYLTTSAAASTYYPLTNPSGFITSSALTGYATESWVTSQGYLTDAPSDGSTYGRLNGAWAVVGGGGSVAWGGITGTLSDQTDLQTALEAKLDLAGGTMTGGLTLSATGIIFSDSTTLTTAPAGSTLAADQLTAGVVTANPTSGPTASGDVLQYDGTNLIWAAGGGGGGLTISTLSNGATSTLDATAPSAGYVLSYNGTDLIWAPDASGLTISTLSNGATSTLNATAPTSGQALTYDGTDLVWAQTGAKSVYTVTSNAYTLAAADANNVVYVQAGASGGFPPVNISIPDDATYSFPVGTVILLAVNNSTGASDVYLVPLGFGAPTILGTTLISSSNSGLLHLVKVAGDTWIAS